MSSGFWLLIIKPRFRGRWVLRSLPALEKTVNLRALHLWAFLFLTVTAQTSLMQGSLLLPCRA